MYVQLNDRGDLNGPVYAVLDDQGERKALALVARTTQLTMTGGRLTHSWVGFSTTGLAETTHYTTRAQAARAALAGRWLRVHPAGDVTRKPVALTGRLWLQVARELAPRVAS